VDYVIGLQADLEKAYRSVREFSKSAALRQKKYYDSRVNLKEFEPGKFVWVYYPRRRLRRYTKWTSYYVGPCRIEKRINSVNYVVRRGPRSGPWVVHIDKMKEFSGIVPEYWKTARPIQVDSLMDENPANNELQDVEQPMEVRIATDSWTSFVESDHRSASRADAGVAEVITTETLDDTERVDGVLLDESSVTGSERDAGVHRTAENSEVSEYSDGASTPTVSGQLHDSSEKRNAVGRYPRRVIRRPARFSD